MHQSNATRGTGVRTVRGFRKLHTQVPLLLLSSRVLSNRIKNLMGVTRGGVF
jgi:hypothetical protein